MAGVGNSRSLGWVGALAGILASSVVWYVASISAMSSTREQLFARISQIEERLGRLEERQAQSLKELERLLRQSGWLDPR